MMSRAIGMTTGYHRRLQRRLAFISVHGDPLASLGKEGAGGQNVYVRRLAEGLAKCGEHVDVYTRSLTGQVSTVQVMPGFQVIRIPVGGAGYVDRLDLAPLLGDFATAVARVQAGRPAYDLIHSHYWLSGQAGRILARRWGIPQVHTSHSLGAVKAAAEGRELPYGDLRRAWEAQILHGVDGLIATSPQEMEDMRRLYQVNRPVRQIPCGADVSVFQPMDRLVARRVLDLPPDQTVLTYVGRLDPIKGIETLLRAADLLQRERPLRVLVAGGYRPGGPDEREFHRLQAIVRQLDLGAVVHFLGALSPAQVALVHGAADLSIVPSLHETFGMTAIEAMACGRPVVASDVGGLAHTVLHGVTGWLVPARDERALAEACSGLLNDPGRCQQLGLFARRRAIHHFTWERVVATMSEVYGDIIASHRHSRGLSV